MSRCVAYVGCDLVPIGSGETGLDPGARLYLALE